MANLNLSEFTEKLFVADADHTFIWDTAASISKRVSRNSWLNSGTLTSDAPVTISQTWNAGSNVMTALKVVATDQASNAGSNMLELWSGNAATLKVRVDKGGNIWVPSGGTIGNAATSLALGGGNFYPAGTSGTISTLGTVFAPFFGIWVGTGSNAAFLTSDSLNTLALRNGAAAQTFRVYNTYTDASNYERGEFVWSGSTFYIQTINLGTGQTRPLSFGGQSMAFRTNSGSGLTERMAITAAGNVGIGTTAPSALLHLNQANATLRFSAGGSSTADIVQDGNQSLLFKRNDVTNFIMQYTGNFGIGTTSPTSKLQVTNGDVEIETVTSGIIMKAAGTSTRYRITLNATGDALVFTAI